ncbi:MAG TPA: hypothetical protein VK922_17295 [Gemmatimonadaceae bacterium]|nr:hypothetical protein [Gemmatimonadaceae bacterium]
MRRSRTAIRSPIARLTIATAWLAGLTAVVPAAAAQGPVALGIGGGVTVPRDRLEGAADRGYHGQLTLRLGVPLVPVHGRIDALHARLGGAPGSAADFAVSGLTASLGIDVVPLAVASMYVVGGAGYYWSRWDGPDAERVRRAGWNAGAGVRLSLGAVRLFGEARYHVVRGDAGAVHFVPFTIGAIF